MPEACQDIYTFLYYFCPYSPISIFADAGNLIRFGSIGGTDYLQE